MDKRSQPKNKRKIKHVLLAAAQRSSQHSGIGTRLYSNGISASQYTKGEHATTIMPSGKVMMMKKNNGQTKRSIIAGSNYILVAYYKEPAIHEAKFCENY